MADPFSVAGTAVGITSLGIQTCQILFRYYSQCKGIHDDIDDVLRRVEGLQGILDSLKGLKERFEIDNHEVALKACEDALHRLMKLADKCDPTVASGSLQDRVRYARKRATWPFKKETVEQLQQTLNGFQHNLSLALQNAGLDVVVRKLDTLDALRDQSSGIEHHLEHHTLALRSIQHSVTNSSVHQEQHSVTISRELLDIRTELSHQTALVKQGLDLMMFSSGPSRNPSQIPPSLLVETCETLENVTPKFRSSLLQYDTCVRQTASHVNVSNCIPLCNCRFKKRQSLKRRGWMTIFSEEVSQHQPECPQFSHGDYSRSVAAQFTLYSRLLGICVRAGWQFSRTGGWSAISPVLRYRAVVSRDSPVFKLFEDTTAALWDLKHSEFSRQQLAAVLKTILSALQRTFGENASPTDLDEHGNGISHAALDLIRVLIRRGFYDVNALSMFLEACFALGVPFDQMDCNREMPVKFLQTSGVIKHPDVFRGIIYCFARKLSSWSCSNNFILYPGYGQTLHDAVSDLLAIQELNDGFDEDDALLRSVIRRSEADFCSHITAFDVGVLKYDYTAALVSWPRGLEILMSSGLCRGDDTLAAAIWRQAIWSLNPASLEILLNHQVQVRISDWFTILRFWNGPSEKFKHKADDQSKVLRAMAMNLLPCDNISSDDFEIAKSSHCGDETTLYHTAYLSTPAAEAAWAAGHCNVDVPGRHNLGTPLWAVWIDNWRTWEPLWSVFKWLLDHGADPTWTHPILLTTPAHCMVRLAIQDAARVESSEPVSHLQNFITMTQPDQCTCYCSQGGCRVVGCAVSTYAYRGYYGIDRKAMAVFHKKRICPWLFGFVDDDRSADWMSSAILRVITFEELSLTHTCCYRIFDEASDFPRFSRPTPEEAKVIHELERDDIDHLDTLVTEFEMAWATYPKKFHKFIKRVWKPRMREVRRERQVDKDLYQTELRRLGVIVNEPGGEQKEEDEEKEVGEGEEESWSVSESESDLSEESTESDGSGWYTTDEEDQTEDMGRDELEISD